jgi:hypothetical protein
MRGRFSRKVVRATALVATRIPEASMSRQGSEKKSVNRRKAEGDRDPDALRAGPRTESAKNSEEFSAVMAVVW